MLPTPFPAAARPRGFTLVELMVSMTIGMVILLGMVMMFVSNTKSQTELEKSNRQTESGRYAMQLLTDDIYNAGYYAEFDPTSMPDPTLPNVCETDIAKLRTLLPLAVQGMDDGATGATCLSDVKANTDVLVVRRVETCILGVGTGNCGPESDGGAFFQASLCSNSNELADGDVTKHFSLQTTVAALNKHKRDCTELNPGTLALARRFVTHIYYVANNHLDGDKIPTLMRASLGGSGTLAFTVEPMAEGIESLQFEYGQDTNADGAPDSYSTAPATSAAWRNVVSVKVHLLSRNTQETKSYTDANTYTLGLTASGQAKTITITDKKYKRHVFSKMITIPNTAGRKTP